MVIHLKCFGILKKYLPPHARRNNAEIEVLQNSTISDLLDELGVKESQVNVFVNSFQIKDFNLPIPEHAEVALILPTSGGVNMA
jgi:sulfur carrier protein ThiS